MDTVNHAAPGPAQLHTFVCTLPCFQCTRADREEWRPGAMLGWTLRSARFARHHATIRPYRLGVRGQSQRGQVVSAFVPDPEGPYENQYTGRRSDAISPTPR